MSGPEAVLGIKPGQRRVERPETKQLTDHAVLLSRGQAQATVFRRPHMRCAVCLV